MISICCSRPGLLEAKKTSYPEQKKGYAILKIKRIGICGTDYHAFTGNQPFFNYPRILGHEVAAEVVQADSTDKFRPGDRVTLSPYFSCGECIACRHGKSNCCVEMSVFGVHVDGGMQEYVSVPESSLVQGKGLDLDQLALIEPLSIGAHGVSVAKVRSGEFVLVIGAGPIGLGTAKLAQLAGGKVIVTDLSESRLDFCRKKLGIPYTINPAKTDTFQELKTITGGEMPTVVMDCSGNQQAINGALKLLAHSGRMVLIGLQKNEIIIAHPEFHKREATMMSSRNALPEDFAQVIHFIKEGLIIPADFISHRIPLKELPAQFDRLLKMQDSVIKAMITFED